MDKLPLLGHTSLDAPFALQRGKVITVRQFLSDSFQLAEQLLAGQHILNLCRDRYHFAVGFTAALLTGKVSLLPPSHTKDMVERIKEFAPDVFCLHDGEADDIATPRLTYPKAAKIREVQIPIIPADQLIAIVFTSGSTGKPLPYKKHWNFLVRNIRAQAERLNLAHSAQDKALLATVPPQHMYGLESSILLPMLTGNILHAGHPFFPADILDALKEIPQRKILITTPLHIRSLLNSIDVIPKLEMIFSATAPLPLQMAYKMESQTAAPLLEIYGSTETGQIATRRPTHKEHWQLLPGIKLFQKANLIWAEGGHIEHPVKLNDKIDLIDESYFTLHGRTHDLINIGGKRTSLAHLNHHLQAIPGIVDGVFFMPDDSATHDIKPTRLCAFVVAPDLEVSAILAELRQRIDPVFLPRPLIHVDALPRNSTGKLPQEDLARLRSNYMVISSS
ncbi:MAG TPA: AMP-binding protein [Methylophilaceae bacterium]|nr:AMP-binding protein [Methylophilaceae bacterium]